MHLQRRCRIDPVFFNAGRAILLLGSFFIMICNGVLGETLQSGSTNPQFEFAVVRRSQPPFVFSGIQKQGEKIIYKNMTLADCLASAYGVDPSKIQAASWIQTERFDISAGLPDASTEESIHLMLRDLLVDRFAIKAHLQESLQQVYVMSVDEKTSQLRPSTKPTETILPLKGGGHGWSFSGVSIDEFLEFLTHTGDNSLDRPLINETGLKGRYDFDLVWVPNGELSEGVGPSVFSAVKELGLRLKSNKRPQKVLVVDSISKSPTEN